MKTTKDPLIWLVFHVQHFRKCVYVYLLNSIYELNRAILENIVNLYFFHKIAIVSYLKMPGETGLAVAKKKACWMIYWD